MSTHSVLVIMASDFAFKIHTIKISNMTERAERK